MFQPDVQLLPGYADVLFLELGDGTALLLPHLHALAVRVQSSQEWCEAYVFEEALEVRGGLRGEPELILLVELAEMGVKVGSVEDRFALGVRLHT